MCVCVCVLFHVYVDIICIHNWCDNRTRNCHFWMLWMVASKRGDEVCVGEGVVNMIEHVAKATWKLSWVFIHVVDFNNNSCASVCVGVCVCACVCESKTMQMASICKHIHIFNVFIWIQSYSLDGWTDRKTQNWLSWHDKKWLKISLRVATHTHKPHITCVCVCVCNGTSFVIHIYKIYVKSSWVLQVVTENTFEMKIVCMQLFIATEKERERERQRKRQNTLSNITKRICWGRLKVGNTFLQRVWRLNWGIQQEDQILLWICNKTKLLLQYCNAIN